MNEPQINFGILLVYYFYGLGFFTMGLAMLLEASRSPALASANLLVPLAGFGLLHGMHEWLEIFLIQLVWLGMGYPNWISIFRISILGISFLLLLIYGSKTGQRRTINLRTKIPVFILLGVYATYILFNASLAIEKESISIFPLIDGLIRYLIAVPAAGFAFLNLRGEARDFQIQNRTMLSRSINITAIGFLIYGITQLFVPYIQMNPAMWINSEAFLSVAGFPIQLIRAIMALVIMFGLVHAVTLVEKERQNQVERAQEARLEALERIQKELTERENLRRELLRHVVRAQEDERSRIARELHDETSQVLSAFVLDLATLRNVATKRKDINLLVDRLLNLGKQMSQGIYRLVHDLRPAQLDDLGLAPALRYLTEKENCPPGFQATFEVNGQERRLDQIIETVLFRVAQEALSNVYRHSKVDNAKVLLIFEESKTILIIEDDGIGFNPEDNFSPPRGWGLAGMQERVDTVDGELNIQSSPGGGTIIEVSIPIN